MFIIPFRRDMDTFKGTKLILLLLTAACTVTLAFPFLLPVGTPDEIDVMRGFELPLFSSVGWIVASSPIVQCALTLSSVRSAVKELLIILMLIVSPSCYFYGMNASYKYLIEVTESHVTLSPASVIYLAMLIVVMVTCFAYVKISNTKENYYEI